MVRTELRRGHAELFAERVREVTVIGIPEVEGELREIGRAAGEMMCGGARSQAAQVPPQTHSGSTVKRSRKVKRRAAESASEALETRRRRQPEMDRERRRLRHFAPASLDGRR